MKHRALALILTLSLTLTGCSSMLSRSYTAVTPHSAIPKAEGDPSTLRVENDQELVNALIYLISKGNEQGTIRLYHYTQDVETALADACSEVVQEDPLGSYAVETLRYDVAPIVAYYEADIQITYRRTHEQVAAIVPATGATAIRNRLKELLASFGEEAALRISYFEGDEAYMQTLIREAYYDVPEVALDLPEAQVFIYPGSGRQRIVELRLTYHTQRKELERQRTALARRANELTVALWGVAGEQAIQDTAKAILSAGRYDPDGGSSAYCALIEGAADSQGMSLAMTLLSRRMDIACQVVEGTLDGQPHFWNVIMTPQGYRHLDLTRELAGGKAVLYSDSELAELGCQWDTQTVPTCGDQPAGEKLQPAD